MIGSAVGGSLGVLVLAIAILSCWTHRRRCLHRQINGHAKSHPHGHRRSEMQGQLTQPTELPSRNSAVMDSHKTATPSTSYEHKVLSPARSSPPASTSSPVESRPDCWTRSLSTTTVPAPLSDSRLGSHVYQHPAHQPLSPQEHFPPPPVRGDISSESALVRPQTAHGRSHELPASKSPVLLSGNVGEMSADTRESASRSMYSLT